VADTDPHRVREIFESARHLTGNERATYLEDTCAGDDALQREVEELLDFLDRSPTTFDATAATSHESGARPVSDHLAPGDVVGRFTIERLLGEGGMGAVYLARQERPQRPVALKLIRSGAMSQRTLGRFRREAELLGRLQHPGIASVHDAGMADTPHGARPYFAMEYVAGRTLLDHAREASLGTRERLALLARVCDAVEHAHRRGIIHRDLKPPNILVTPDGQPKVLDFGVARATDSDLQITTVQTDVGQLIGTIPYMSPEQAVGDTAAFDARSDVYALGVIAYQLLVGRLPYDLSGKMIHEAVRVIHDEEPAPLSSLDRTLRGDVETIVGKALEKERGRRYQSAAELAADIDRHLADEPISARPPSTVYQLRKFARRNKALVGGVVATFAVLLAGVVVSTALALGQARERRLAEARLAEAEAVTGFMTEAFAAPTPSAAGANVTARQVVDAAAELLDDRFEDQPIARARAQSAIGSTYKALSQHTEAIPLLEAARETQRRLLGPEDPSTLATTNELAEMYRRVDRTGEAESLLRDLIETYTRLHGPDSYHTISVRLDLANLCDDDFERFDEAAAIYDDVLAALEADPNRDAQTYITCLINLGVLRARQERLDEARDLYRRADEQLIEHEGPDAARRATVLNNLAFAEQRADRYEEAEPLLVEAIRILDATHGPDHEGSAIARSSLARLHLEREEYAEAEALFLAAADTMATIHGPDHPRALIAEGDIASVYRRTGRLDEALAVASSVVERARAALPEGHWFIGAFLSQEGSTLIELERFPEAEAALLESHALHENHFGPDHFRTANIIRSLVRLYDAWPDPGKAETWRAKLPPEEPGAAAS
jgi:tetratricopeptide (TPR) repeat protein/predicted Ser/Thr protein kinase